MNACALACRRVACYFGAVAQGLTTLSKARQSFYWRPVPWTVFYAMKKFLALAILVLGAGLVLCSPSFAGAPVVQIETSMGNIVVRLEERKAPITCENFLKYVKSGFYDGTIFHRVIKGFMIQGGGFTQEMKEKPTHAPIKNEASIQLRNRKYTIAMARTSAPDSATAQFFINTANNRFINQWSDVEVLVSKGCVYPFLHSFREMFPTRHVDFLYPDSTRLTSIRTSEFHVGTRLSKNEIVVRQTFDKMSMGSDYPILGVDVTAGLKNVLNSDYEYCRLELSVKHDFDIAPIGYSDVLLSGGKIFGRVPYPLLKLHEGNATYFYDPNAFSCMDFYEFASDLWCAVFWEHHFRGFFLGKIPLMKRLKWREVATVKALWGSLSDKNDGSSPDTEAILLFPEGMTSVSKPYVEVGVGIENILRFIRVDAMWRLTHRDRHDGRPVDNFAVNFSLHLNF